MPRESEEKTDEDTTYADRMQRAKQLLQKAELSNESKLLLAHLSLVPVEELDKDVIRKHPYMSWAKENLGTDGLLVVNWQELCELLERLEANPFFMP